MELKTRGLFILALVVVGALLASAVTEYYSQEEPLKHHVTSGKVGTNPDGTIWVAESFKNDVLFNFTLPASSVHSRYITYSSILIVAVPDYSQDFELSRTVEGLYTVYYPARTATIPVSNLKSYESTRDKTILVEAYHLFSQSLSDVRVLSRIQESSFAINGVVTSIHKDGSASINGYILTVGKLHYMILLDEDYGRVVAVTQIDFEYK